jgi:hypothetical protein
MWTDLKSISKSDQYQIRAGLPDGFFKPKIQILGYFGGLGMLNIVIFYDHLEYFTALWYNVWPLGIVYGCLV